MINIYFENLDEEKKEEFIQKEINFLVCEDEEHYKKEADIKNMPFEEYIRGKAIENLQETVMANA